MKITFFATLIICILSFPKMFSQQGLLDREFGKNGIIMHSFDTTFLSYNEATAMAIQADGKIVVGGRSAQNLVLARFNENGELDKSFGDTGAVFIEEAWLASDRINDLSIQPDGKIVAIVQSYYFDPDIQVEWGNTIIMRFLPNGMFDDDFGYQTGYADHGTAYIETGHDIVQGKSIALQADGKILIGGIAKNEFGNVQYIFISRINTDGTMDFSFTTDGFEVIDIGNHYTILSDMLLQPDGKILLGGRLRTNTIPSQSKFFVARLTSNGFLDDGFGDGGVLSSPLASSNYFVRKLMLLEDGNILAWINKEWFPTNLLDIAQIKPDGNFNGSFGTNGVLTIPTDSIPYITKILADDEGGFYLTGYKRDSMEFSGGPGNFALAKLTPEFTNMQEFGSSGVAITDVFNGNDDRVNDAAILPNNKVLLAGFSSSIYYEAKLALAQYFGIDTIAIIDTILPSDSLILNENGLTILPNPVGEDFQICYPLEEKSIISIDIYNSIGKLLHTLLTKEVRDKGLHCEHFDWPKEIIEKGVYFLRLSGRKFAYSAKIFKP